MFFSWFSTLLCTFVSHLVWHPFSFFACVILFCYTSLLVVFVSVFLYHLHSAAFPRTLYPPDFIFHDFMLMACCYSQHYHILNTFCLLYSIYYLCLLLLFSQFIFSPILTDFPSKYCSFFYWPKPIVLLPAATDPLYNQRCKPDIDCSGSESKMLWIFTCIHRCDYSGVFMFSLYEDRRSFITGQPGNT